MMSERFYDAAQKNDMEDGQYMQGGPKPNVSIDSQSALMHKAIMRDLFSQLQDDNSSHEGSGTLHKKQFPPSDAYNKAAQRDVTVRVEPAVLIKQMLTNIERVIIGKREVIEQLLVAMLCGGHVLLEDVPGVGKTVLARAIAATLDLSFGRIQCTPDLLPSDIVGVEIWHRQKERFEFQKGPVFAHLVLADELNRASAKTQAALLEAMAEGQVTSNGMSYALAQPFLVLATQNPLAFEGTYALPEAQLDRFMMRVQMGYPSAQDEIVMLERMQETHPLTQLKPIVAREEWRAMQREVKRVYVDAVVKRYIVELIVATREHPELVLGASPRATLSLMLASQAKAYMNGRTYVIPDDVKQMAVAVLAHRLVVTSQGNMAGLFGEQIIEELLRNTPVPSNKQAARS